MNLESYQNERQLRQLHDREMARVEGGSKSVYGENHEVIRGWDDWTHRARTKVPPPVSGRN